MVKTKIIKVKGDWEEVATDCRATVSKPPLGKEPSDKFKREMLVCEHSPIRDISIKWKWTGIPHWVGVHWVRHKWECFVATQRTDRTGVPRDKLPQNTPQDFTGEANTQHLIDTQRKRLCYQASSETREQAEDLKTTISSEVDEHIGWAMVPNCIYRGGCPEMKCCGYYYELLKLNPDIASSNIQKRYDAYNNLFPIVRKEPANE